MGSVTFDQADFDARFKVFEEQHEAGLTIGLAKINGVVNRQDIDVLLHNEPECFNLFILAMKELHDLPNHDKMSFFQIAGIHGYPKRPWNNIPNKNMDTSNDSGYCHHGKTTFPTWHRPYLVMLEQALFINMIRIARKFDEPHRSRYIQAALKFRLPFWDWFRPRGYEVQFDGIVDDGKTCAPYDYSAPRIFTQERVTVRLYPDDKPSELAENPFHHFNFEDTDKYISQEEWEQAQNSNKSKEGDKEIDLKLNRIRTARHPYPIKGEDDPTFKWDNPMRLNNVLNELRMDSNRYLLAMMTSNAYDKWETFSTSDDNTKQKKHEDPDGKHKNAEEIANAQGSGSLEAVHNMYHGLCGGWVRTSHMGIVSLAAFDPIFWFHHSNIERIFTIWQRTHRGQPNDWFTDDPKVTKDFLFPFQRPEEEGKDNQFWNSNTVRNTTDLGYSFDDVLEDPDATRKNFLELYKWSVPDRRSNSWWECPEKMRPLDLEGMEFFNPPGDREWSKPLVHDHFLLSEICTLSESLKDRLEELKDPDNWARATEDTYDWYIDDKVQRMALNGPFSILYFIELESGHGLDDLEDCLSPTLAGMTYVFASSRETCGNCLAQHEHRQIVTNTIPITSQLLDFIEIGKLNSLDPKDVVPFLTDRLRWRIRAHNGQKVDTREMSQKRDLRVGISSVRHTGMPMWQADVPPVHQRHDKVIKDIIAKSDASHVHHDITLAV